MSQAASLMLSLWKDGISSNVRTGTAESASARQYQFIPSKRRSFTVSSPPTGIAKISVGQLPRLRKRRGSLPSKCTLDEETGKSQRPRDSVAPDVYTQTSATRGSNFTLASTLGGPGQIEEDPDSRGKLSAIQQSSARPSQTAGQTPASNAALAAWQRAQAYKAKKTKSSSPPREIITAAPPRPREMGTRLEDPSVPPVQPPESDQPVSLSSLMPSEMQKMQESELLAALASTSPTTTAPTSNSDIDSYLSTPSPSTKSDQLEVQIITRDGIITRKMDYKSQQSDSSRSYKGKGISSTDFLGLGFEDKKDPRATPAGLRAPMDMPRGSLPSVEILTREANSSTSADAGEGSLYKPKVSTWGVFPRPRDISSTYGGGRTIRPGEPLETVEEKAGREAKTRQLLEKYRRVAGLDIDAGTKSRCQQCLERGGELMDGGRLREALEEFEVVLTKTVFQSPIHGQALLQKAVCLDSMARSGDAKEMYEKLSTHPDGGIRKKSRQLLFGFQAAQNLRVSERLDMDTSLYRPYFDAFADGYNSTYKASEEEKNSNVMMEALPYAVFLILPLVLVLAVVFF